LSLQQAVILAGEEQTWRGDSIVRETGLAEEVDQIETLGDGLLTAYVGSIPGSIAGTLLVAG
jgi:hypothetical protein